MRIAEPLTYYQSTTGSVVIPGESLMSMNALFVNCYFLIANIMVLVNLYIVAILSYGNKCIIIIIINSRLSTPYISCPIKSHSKWSHCHDSFRPSSLSFYNCCPHWQLVISCAVHICAFIKICYNYKCRVIPSTSYRLGDDDDDYYQSSIWSVHRETVNQQQLFVVLLFTWKFSRITDEMTGKVLCALSIICSTVRCNAAVQMYHKDHRWQQCSVLSGDSFRIYDGGSGGRPPSPFLSISSLSFPPLEGLEVLLTYSSGVRVRGTAEIKFSAFSPQNIASGESKLNIFSEANRLKMTLSALFCDLGDCMIHDIWEATLCVWGLSPRAHRL